jgi:hypothetical protein
MQFRRTLRLGLLALTVLTSQQIAAATAPKATAYVGTIGKGLKIEMQLIEEPIMQTNNGETYQSGIRYTGTYSYVNQGKPIKVSGCLQCDGDWRSG